MGYLGYKSLKMFKNLSNRIDFKEITLNKLCKDCQKRDQTYQLLKNLISQVIKFLV